MRLRLEISDIKQTAKSIQTSISLSKHASSVKIFSTFDPTRFIPPVTGLHMHHVYEQNFSDAFLTPYKSTCIRLLCLKDDENKKGWMGLIEPRRDSRTQWVFPLISSCVMGLDEEGQLT